MGQSSQRRTFTDHDRTRRPLDKARQNRRVTQFPSIVLPCEQLARVRRCARTAELQCGLLLSDAGIPRADLDDPDARIPCAAWGAMFRQALALRPMKNVGMRLAMVTPFGAFPLIDYLIATSQSVGEGLKRLAHYLRLVEARSVPVLREDENPIRVLLEGPDTPLSAEFTVTINLLLCREETDGRFHAAYAS